MHYNYVKEIKKLDINLSDDDAAKIVTVVITEMANAVSESIIDHVKTGKLDLITIEESDDESTLTVGLDFHILDVYEYQLIKDKADAYDTILRLKGVVK